MTARYEVSARILAVEHEPGGDVVRLHRKVWLTVPSLEPETIANALVAALERTAWERPAIGSNAEMDAEKPEPDGSEDSP